jgi:hypothetical protein
MLLLLPQHIATQFDQTASQESSPKWLFVVPSLISAAPPPPFCCLLLERLIQRPSRLSTLFAFGIESSFGACVPKQIQSEIVRRKDICAWAVRRFQ